MIRFLIYLFPAFVCYIQGSVFFFSADSFSRAGESGFLVGCTVAVWALVYAIVSAVAGRKVTDKNSVWFIMTGAFFLAAASIGFLCTLSSELLYFQFLWIVMVGIGGSSYCTAFQVFMKTIEPDRDAGIVRPTALYTFSWSCGMAAGPFLLGVVGPKTAFLCSILLCILIVSGIFLISRMPPLAPKPREKERGDSVDYTQGPNCAMIGWIVGGVTTLSVSLIRALEPYRAAALNFTKEDAAYALALLSVVQGFTALSLIRSRLWMYRPFRAFLIGVCGVIGLLFFSLGTQPLHFYIAALLYGVYSGCLYFYFVFYSLAHKDSGKYVSVNEAVVGVVSIIGPVAGGLVGRGTSPLPFLFPAVLVFGAAVYQMIALKRKDLSCFRSTHQNHTK